VIAQAQLKDHGAAVRIAGGTQRSLPARLVA